MNEPKIWSLEELTRDSETSRELFRKQRLDEPLALYSEFFNDFIPVFGRIIDRLPRLAEDAIDPEAMPDLVREGDSLTAFRYLAAPPVSEDDLKTLAETTLSATALRSNPGGGPPCPGHRSAHYRPASFSVDQGRSGSHAPRA